LAVQELKDSELRYRRLFETAQDGILILDAATGSIIDVNPFLIEMLGYSREEFIGKKLWEVGAFKDIQASKDAFLALQKNEYIRYKDLPLKAKDGKLYQVEFVSNVYMVGDEKVIQCNIRDITERKHAQDALEKSEANMREQVERDHLTGLFNRRYMEVTLDRELRRASRKKSSLGIIMMDVDDFKAFNDTYGHSAGDEILREIGQLLQKHVRQEDIPSRFGGDEFLIVLPDVSLEVTRKRAELLCEDAHKIQIQFEGRTLEQISLSVGVAIFPDHGSTRDLIIKAADNALYQAKHEGRNQVVVAK
jgi:diguanylate cyclase (GGDEF)-like protein/PAS domain S-box-containing protein